MHHRQDAYSRRGDGIQDGIWKTTGQALTHRPPENRRCFRVLDDGLDALLYFLKKLQSEAVTL